MATDLEHAAVVRLKELLKEKGSWLIEKQRLQNKAAELRAENMQLKADAAELRAAVRKYRHARDWYRYAWGTPDENGAHGRLAAADEALHRLAATEGQA